MCQRGKHCEVYGFAIFTSFPEAVESKFQSSVVSKGALICGRMTIKPLQLFWNSNTLNQVANVAQMDATGCAASHRPKLSRMIINV